MEEDPLSIGKQKNDIKGIWQKKRKQGENKLDFAIKQYLSKETQNNHDFRRKEDLEAT